MPWDPGTPIDQRPAIVQQRIAALPANTFAPFDPPIVVEDEIDLCLRWPDVPRPPSTAAPLPYPTVPTLILQGGEDLRTPPEVSARVAARIPGAVRIVVPGTGHSTVSDPRTCSRRRSTRFIAGKSLPKSRASASRPASRPCWARRSRSIRCGPRRAAAQDRPDRAARWAPRSTISGSWSPRPLSRPRAGACAAAPGSIDGNKLVLRHYEAVTGVTVSGSGNARTHAARCGLQSGERRSHAALRRTPVRNARRAQDLAATRRSGHRVRRRLHRR